jgi:hypothetical protein
MRDIIEVDVRGGAGCPHPQYRRFSFIIPVRARQLWSPRYSISEVRQYYSRIV